MVLMVQTDRGNDWGSRLQHSSNLLIRCGYLWSSQTGLTLLLVEEI